jgi:tRNA threonylcarbamoyladenosine biosynthesis protein TsaE
MELVLRTETAEDTRAVGAAIAPLLRARDVVVLTGELAAGKTTFVQGVAVGLGAQEHVASPTFTLVREYTSGRVPLAHVDIYRLERIQEVLDLALDELEDGERVLMIEWGDAVEELLAEDRLKVELTTVGEPNGEARRLTLGARGPSWGERWMGLERSVEPWRTGP